jgi:folate-binding protein YgfZ
MSPIDTAGDLHAFRRRHERGILRVTGRDRIDWLNGLLTNDLKAREGPRACPALWLTPQGRMVTDLIVIELGEETWLDVPASLATALAERFDRMIFAEDARVTDASAEWTSTGVYGAGTDALERVSEAAAIVIRPATASRGQVVYTSALGSGLPGLHVYHAHADAQRFEESVLAGWRRLDDREAEVLRVERGVPLFLVDTREETIPLEAGLDATISHTKGCYIGQEIIVRIRDRAHGRVARRLVGLTFSGSAVPAVPQSVTSDGRQAGRITSAVMSPALGHPIALATLLRDFTEPGTSVVLDDGTPAVVTDLPFVG